MDVRYVSCEHVFGECDRFPIGISPLAIVTTFVYREKSKKITIPWFAILFIVVAIFNSFHLLPQSVVNMLVTLDTFLLAMAMAALGLTTHVSALKKAGAKPLLMALVLFAWLIVGGGAINYVIQSVIA